MKPSGFSFIRRLITPNETGGIGFEAPHTLIFMLSFTPDGTLIIDFIASRSNIPDNKPLSGLNPITAVSSAVK